MSVLPVVLFVVDPQLIGSVVPTLPPFPPSKHHRGGKCSHDEVFTASFFCRNTRTGRSIDTKRFSFSGISESESACAAMADAISTGRRRAAVFSDAGALG
jgi:hypothetical protein